MRHAPLLLMVLTSACTEVISLGSDFAVVVPDAALDGAVDGSAEAAVDVVVDRPTFDVPVDRADAATLDGTADGPVDVPARPSGSLVALALGDGHTCALWSDGRLWCWGRNDRGQLGLGDTTDRDRPARVEGLTDVRAVAAGRTHTCAITADAALWCWGRNDRGQLSLDAGDDVRAPTRTAHLADAVTAGASHTCFVHMGRVRCAGDDGGDVALPRSATAITAADDATCATLDDGALWCWGRNVDGELGRGTTGAREALRPAMVSGVTGVRAGARHVSATVSDAVRCWGDRRDGALGDGVVGDALSTPADIATWRGTEVAAGDGFTCALGLAHVVCVGRNDGGQLGDGMDTARRATPDGQVVGFSRAPPGVLVAGARHVCAIERPERVWCWGDGTRGALGDGNRSIARLRVLVAF